MAWRKRCVISSVSSRQSATLTLGTAMSLDCGLCPGALGCYESEGCALVATLRGENQRLKDQLERTQGYEAKMAEELLRLNKLEFLMRLRGGVI